MKDKDNVKPLSVHPPLDRFAESRALCRAKKEIADFEFNEEVVTVFPDMIERAVPGYGLSLAMMEVFEIAKGIGHNLDEHVIEEYLEMPESSQEMRTSTLQDLLKGKHLEVEAINGAVVTNGKKLGIHTPYNSSLYALLKLINNKPH